MSNALAIAAVTAVLRDFLNDGLINHNVSGILGSSVTVSALPPDRVVPGNSTESTQLNLFLHRLAPNMGWRNSDLPARDRSGRYRLSNPLLALDLHYLLSAYSADELGAEILLGHAMQLLHETPVLDRRIITAALNASASSTDLPVVLQALAGSGLAEQFEQIKLVPEFLSTEEMSKLWTAAQSHYRPTVAYQASVVLIESAAAARVALPVLSRGAVDPATGRERGVAVQPGLLPAFPAIHSVSTADGQSVATVGSTLEFTGHHLDGSRAIVFSNPQLAIEQEVPATAGNSATGLQVVVPALPVGVYQVAASVLRPTDIEARTSNQLAVVIGPKIATPLPMSVSRDESGTATIILECEPRVRPHQRAALLLAGDEVIAEPFIDTTATLTFTVPRAAAGEYLARLRIDGIESPIIDRKATPPAFFNYRISVS